jgi:anti-sigma regulatory factor (Ser/Thr protein kinase)
VALTGGRGLPLATIERGTRPESVVELPPGATLLLFTDGLVERREESIDIGFAHVAELLAEAGAATPGEAADLVLTQLRPAAGYDDDVAMLVYRQPPAPLRIEAPAAPRELSTLRHELSGWLTRAAVSPQLIRDIIAATNEACTNVVEHAYLHRPHGNITLDAVANLSQIIVTVSDTGSWRPVPANPGDRGRGLAMMRALANDVDIADGTGGSSVSMRFALRLVRFPDRQ